MPDRSRSIGQRSKKEPASGGPEKSPTIEEANMAPRTIKAIETETISALRESTALPISVGNPMAADSLAIDQSHMEEFASAEEKSFDVRIDRPPKGHYFTVRAEPVKPWKDRAFYFLLEIEGRDSYIVAPAIAKLKADEDVIRPVLIARYVTMAGEEGLWALKLDKPDAKSNRYNKTALNVLEEAEKGWVRLISAKGHYRYSVSPTKFEQTPPKFSSRTFQELFGIAFKDRIVTSLDHEIWNALDRGSDK
jgi:hypothetical protein